MICVPHVFIIVYVFAISGVALLLGLASGSKREREL